MRAVVTRQDRLNAEDPDTEYVFRVRNIVVGSHKILRLRRDKMFLDANVVASECEFVSVSSSSNSIDPGGLPLGSCGEHL